MICVFPECKSNTDTDNWCLKHWGLFPHPCEREGCDKNCIYDDEPFCFAHSPDSGSSIKGYSAYKKFRASQELK